MNLEERRATQELTTRPWGEYFKMYQEPGVWVKRIEVNPGARLSLQKHNHRSEKWIVVKGTGIAIIADNHIAIQPGSTIDVPLGALHRLCNTHTEDPLVIIEVATGDTLTEEDIIRVDDDYQRQEGDSTNG